MSDELKPFPIPLFELGPLVVTDTVLVSFALSVLLVGGGALALRAPRARRLLEDGYEALEHMIVDMTHEGTRPLVPLIVTLWGLLGIANLISVIPGVRAPMRDLSITSALALIAFFAGHVMAIRKRGLRYLRHYIEPNVLLLPFNVIGELGRTLAMALRLFGNMLSGHLIAAIVLMLAGLFVPIPLMVLGILTGLVQAYIFGVLTLVFAASSIGHTEPNPSLADDAGAHKESA